MRRITIDIPPKDTDDIRNPNDYRMGMDADRKVKYLSELPPHKYTEDEVLFFFGDMHGNDVDEDSAYDGFLQWVKWELQSEKIEQEQPLYRHKVILFQGMQYAMSDISYHSNESTITEDMHPMMLEMLGLEVGDSYPIITIGVYTALRTRNPTFSRKSFTAGEDMWDELADLI